MVFVGPRVAEFVSSSSEGGGGKGGGGPREGDGGRGRGGIWRGVWLPGFFEKPSFYENDVFPFDSNRNNNKTFCNARLFSTLCLALAAILAKLIFIKPKKAPLAVANVF